MRCILDRGTTALLSLSLLFAICEQPVGAAEPPSAKGSLDAEDGATVRALPEVIEPYERLDLPSDEFRTDIYSEDADYLPVFDAGADLLIFGSPNGFGISQSRRGAAIPAYRAHLGFNAANGLGGRVTWWTLNSPYSTGQLTEPNGQLASSLNLSELRAEAAYTTAIGSGDLSMSAGFALVSLDTFLQLDQQRSFASADPNLSGGGTTGGGGFGGGTVGGGGLGGGGLGGNISSVGITDTSPPPTTFRSRSVQSGSITAPGFTLGVTGRQRIGTLKSAWILASLQWTNVFGDARYSSYTDEWAGNVALPAPPPSTTMYNQLSLFGFRLGPSWTKDFDNGVTLAWAATMEAEIVTQLGLNSGSSRMEGSVFGMGANFGLSR